MFVNKISWPTRHRDGQTESKVQMPLVAWKDQKSFTYSSSYWPHEEHRAEQGNKRRVDFKRCDAWWRGQPPMPWRRCWSLHSWGRTLASDALQGPLPSCPTPHNITVSPAGSLFKNISGRQPRRATVHKWMARKTAFTSHSLCQSWHMSDPKRKGCQ